MKPALDIQEHARQTARQIAIRRAFSALGADKNFDDEDRILAESIYEAGRLAGLIEARDIAARTGPETIWHCDGFCPVAIEERINNFKLNRSSAG